MRRYFVYLAIVIGSIAILFLIIYLLKQPGEKRIYRSLAEKMAAEQIEARGVKDEKVLQAMRTVPRHKFVSDELKPYAYEDRPLPIGCGQTISQPYIVALMTELLKVDEEDKVLEVGTGSGYQAAILSGMVKEVYTIEIFEELGTSAKNRLKELGYSNVKVRVADGYYGWPEEAPFDAIIVTCAATHIPPPLIAQLKEDGKKMCIPVGGVFQVQNLMLIEKREGKITSKNILPVRFVPMLGKH
ncbi:MAG: protein-L-isoaspartate(D-aspartate) O-methyltransferase [Candidatus Aerophobetes bacterium]|nr:protein-L-isoaspartate(D-aspartate) O-methyltransferase [Candidatus Aerophobetes bacterium]